MQIQLITMRILYPDRYIWFLNKTPKKLSNYEYTQFEQKFGTTKATEQYGSATYWLTWYIIQILSWNGFVVDGVMPDTGSTLRKHAQLDALISSLFYKVNVLKLNLTWKSALMLSILNPLASQKTMTNVKKHAWLADQLIFYKSDNCSNNNLNIVNLQKPTFTNISYTLYQICNKFDQICTKREA